MLLFLIDMASRLANMTAVGNVVGNMIAQTLTFLDGKSVLGGVDHTFAAQGAVGNMLGQDTLSRSVVGGTGRPLSAPATVVIP